MADIKSKFENVFLVDGKLAVKNLVQGYSPFGDELIKAGKDEYLSWNPTRSKLAAAIVKGLKIFPICPGAKVLYLGIAHGYSASKVACIVGKEGIIYGVEFSERPFTELLPIAEKLGNIMPILADARMPEKYNWVEQVDVVFCDIADTQMSEAAIRNARQFLKMDGFVMIAIKARSIDVVANPRTIVEQEVKKFQDAGFDVVQWMMLDPLERDHGFILARMK
jgi:fibrillarin-like pre-rRNA processing protein